ncbi:tail length tape measure protein [Rhodobacter aestuarii]|uniref:Prophage tail length tape measure protein n=1 Tax=Rhodobacter aestuarii TaxID=453582 RepID=A0A1N7Q1A2_9RHOB|nr:phage tail tip lysozyme [Rhodobacter aestuarii]PTV94016.1 tail length tape measure protein [Rhodobacter aestuarii]SIT16591.1 Prophage tail length tape measure protein [Rhodobacter aestuarii]
MSGPMVYELLFRGDASSAKAAAAEVQAATGKLKADTQAATSAIASDTTATLKNTDAKRAAARAAKEVAEAEAAARAAYEQSQYGWPVGPTPLQYQTPPRQNPVPAPVSSPRAPSTGAASAYAANLSFQLNDIAMMTMAGQNPMMLMMQQGTQVTQVFTQMRASGMATGTALRGAFMGMLNPMSLATMAVIGFGTAAVQWLLDTGEEAKTLDEALGNLESSTSAVKAALKEAKRGTADLAADFGSGARAARELNIALLQLAQMEAAQRVRTSIKSVGEAVADMHSVFNFGVVDSRTLEKQFNLTARGAQEVSAAIQKFEMADTFESKVEAAKGIAEAMANAEYNSDGANEAATKFGTSVGTASIHARILEGTTEQIDALTKEIAKSGIDVPFETAAEKGQKLADLLDDVMKTLEKTRAPFDLEDDLEMTRRIGEATLQYGADSLEVKRLQIEAERQNFEAQLRTLDTTEEHKKKLLELWDAAKGLQSVDPFGALAAGKDYLRTQTESLAKTQLELGLIGQTEATRRRILALYEAEQQIRDMHLDPSSTMAADIRATATAAAEAEAQLDRVRSAWETVQGAGEDAIDGIIDALKQGDIGGAFEAMATEIEGMFTELALTNPLKNALFGTDYATMADVGGLGGIWDRLTGKAGPLEVTGVSSQSVGAMTVTAAQVIINGGLGLGAASLSGVPTGGLAGSADVQSQVWQFFANKGLQPHQIAGIMGNVSRESSFDPTNVGDFGQAFGLFQHNDRKGALFDFIGGKGNLGNVNAQLEFAWHELMTSEAAAMKRLLASTNVRDATAAFAGFERPKGYTLANPAGADGWSQRLGAAEAAMAKFGATATTTTDQLGTMGNGFNSFGAALNNLFQGDGAGGSAGGFFGNLIGGLLGLPGFAAGGDHAGGWRIVGENGPEIEATGAARIFNASETRSILSSPPPAANAASTPPIAAAPAPATINIHNYTSEPIQQATSQGPDGESMVELIVGRQLAQGKHDKRLRSRYALKPEVVKR